MSSITLSLALRGRLLSGTQTTFQGALFGNNEPGFSFEPWDITTLYQDRAGTTPVTAVGQSVGLRLDKSKGLALGPELVTNGDFGAGSTGWTVTAPGTNTVTVSGGSVRFVTNGSADTATLSQPWAGATAVGKYYRITFDVLPGSTGMLKITTLGVNSAIGEQTFTATPGAKSFTLVSSNATTIGIARVVSASADATIDNISVRELAGNHQVAINDAARGIYGWMPKTGRRNLLTYTEQFDNAAWGKTNATVTANAEIAPDGTLTADKVEVTGAAPNVSQDIVVNSTSVTLSAYFKKGTGATSANALLIRNQTLGTNLVAARVNLDTGAITYILGSSGAVSESAGNGWWKLTLTASITSGNTVRSGILGGYAATVGDFSFIWGAQLELGSTATAYQRVVSNYDVTEAGVPSCYYVLANGVNTAYSTPTITPGTDKVQVFAGVRKNSDAAIGMVVEFSANVNSNNGTFWMAAPIVAGVANYDFASKGTIGRSKTRTGFAAPITNVLTGIGDISGDIANLRVNGNDAGATTIDQGTGNYLAYPAYIYARGGTSLPFNGYDFGHVVRFGPNLDAATIARVEAMIARNTPEVTL